MSERLEDFVELYPIHPAYIDTFNKVYIAEKREVLKTISITVKRLLEEEIPDEAPGIVSFDSSSKAIWAVLNNSPYTTREDYEDVIMRGRESFLQENNNVFFNYKNKEDVRKTVMFSDYARGMYGELFKTAQIAFDE